MSQKNETATLILALLMTAGAVGGGLWWLMRDGKLNLEQLGNSKSRSTQTEHNPPSGNSPASFARVEHVPSGLFNYGGSTTWAPIRRDLDPVLQTVWTEFRLRYTDPVSGAPGSGSGIRMLLENQLAFSQSSRSIKDEEYQKAEQRGFRLKEIPVAIDGIAVAVHPDLPITGLTVAQVRDIYTGKITNWNQVGGPTLAIIPYSRRIEEGGTIEFFVENMLEKQAFGSTVEFISTTTQALREVARNRGSIYYASAPEVVGQCTVRPLPIGRQSNTLVPPYQEPFVPLSQCPAQRNQLNTAAFQAGNYPITRRLFVIVKQNGQTDQQAGEAYANLLLTNQGQELIEKAGFVRIR
jgi:phosphate transport system substrate-binding protein